MFKIPSNQQSLKFLFESLQSVKKFFTLSYELEVELSLWKYYTTPKLKELIDVFNFMTETVMRYVDKAVERLDAKEKNTDDSVKSVLEKLLEVDRKLAVVMALDMILAGVDTVSVTTLYVSISLGSITKLHSLTLLDIWSACWLLV